jgi:hypothetical protein
MNMQLIRIERQKTAEAVYALRSLCSMRAPSLGMEGNKDGAPLLSPVATLLFLHLVHAAPRPSSARLDL